MAAILRCARFRAGPGPFLRSQRAIATEVEERATTGVDRVPTRRNFIVWYLAGLLTATVVAVVAPIVVFIFPPRGENKKQDIKIRLDKPSTQLQPGQAIKFDAPKETGFVMKDGGGDNAPGKIAFSAYLVKSEAGKLEAFAVNCSHLGCSVQLNEGERRFDCPCHGSRFALSGKVLHGPAAYPLSHLTWKPGDSPDEIVVYSVGLKGIG